MTRLPIIIAPDPRLKGKAEPVDAVDDEINTLMMDMLETMHDANGIGLAAPQVGVRLRVLVMDLARDDEPSTPICMANPELMWVSEELCEHEEGCLSLPEQFADVTRPTAVRVSYLDQNNTRQEWEASDLLAVCVQHEMDHLDGTLFVDHVSGLKRNMILRRLKKSRRNLPSTA